MKGQFNNQPYKIYHVGGNPLIDGDHVAFAHTFLAGARRLAIADTNVDNGDAKSLTQEDYLPPLVQQVKAERGWDYGDYELYVFTADGKPEEVNWSKDPESQSPTFGAINRPVDPDWFNEYVRSFEEKPPQPIHIEDHDLSKYQAFEHDLE